MGKPGGLMDYDAIYLAGGHGTCTDFVDNPQLKSMIEGMLAAGKVVAADCHGPIALAQCCKPTGEPLVQGLTVTGFCDSEEAAVQLTDKVPFLIETKFKELGAKYEKGGDVSSSREGLNLVPRPNGHPSQPANMLSAPPLAARATKIAPCCPPAHALMPSRPSAALRAVDVQVLRRRKTRHRPESAVVRGVRRRCGQAARLDV